MAGKRQYTDEDIDEFIEVAQMSGLSPAIKQLGYPSFPTAQKWFREKDLEMPSIDTLKQKAGEMRVFYGDVEKKYGLQAIMEAIVEKVQEKDLDADGLNKLANAYNKAIVTYNLIEGKATGISETHNKDSIDLGVADVLNAAKARNSLKEAELG